MQQAKDGALQRKRCNTRQLQDYHTKIADARVVMNEQTGPAQPPGDSSDV
jgi:hypothetical protein